jgi:small GTP-binding protein
MGILNKVTPERRTEHKICVLGDFGVGKSSLIRRYTVDKFDVWYKGGRLISKKEELYVSIEENGLPKSDVIGLKVWDWLERLTQKHSYINAKGALLVCNATDKSTLRTLEYWKNELFKIAGEVPIVVVGNKIDLKDEIEIKREDLVEAAVKLNASYIWTSAKTGKNVEEAFYKLAKTLI